MSLDPLSLPLLLGIFAAAAATVWSAGVKLSDATDVLSDRMHLGEALGGLILLAVATNLPEIAIVASGAARGNLELATGNIFGGIAVQTLVLALLDLRRSPHGREPLSWRAADLTLVLEGLLVIAFLAAGITASRLPETVRLGPLTPGGVAIAVFWVAGLALINRARRGLPWKASGDAPGGQDSAEGKAGEDGQDGKDGGGLGGAAAVFAVASIVTLAGGVALEWSGEAIAKHIHMTGVVFGATLLAAATALPEISTGLAAIKLGDDKLAVSDIFGGNAFLPVLFLPASLIAARPVLPQTQASDLYLAALGMLMTSVYLCGLVMRPRRRVAGVGPDSLATAILYALGVIGLFAVAGAHGG